MKQLPKIPPFTVHFLRRDEGAVTVDYVVILGAVIGLGLAVTGSVASGTIDYGDGISSYLLNVDVSDDTSDGSDVAATGDNGSDTGTDSESDQSDGSDQSASDSSSDSTDSSSDGSESTDGGSGDSGSGNPGNDKDVGNAGETPNGNDNWGSGSNGVSS